MNKKIIFQKCKLDYIYFLLYIIVYASIRILIFFIKEEDYVKENPNKYNNNHFNLSLKILISYLSNISVFLSIIPYFIRKKLLKKRNISSKKEASEIDNNDNESKEKKELIYNDIGISEAKKRKKLLIIYCTLAGIFDFIKEFIEIINYINFRVSKF